ncbi:MAG: PDZ domain-containing protein, partial [Longimicrobiales bacterium]
LITVTPAVRAERGIRSEGGALIADLSAAAERALGLQEGDVIVQINRVPVRTAEAAAELLRRLAGRGAVRVIFERDGQLVATWFTIG